MVSNRLGLISAIVAVTALLALGAATTGGAGTSRQADVGNVVFLSTQLNAITESEAFRNTLVKGFPGSVQKIDVPLGNATFFFDRVKAESASGTGTISLLGGLHGDFATIPTYLTDLTSFLPQLKAAGIPPELLKLGKLGTNQQLYIPWMQATYLMVANRSALPYLPKGSTLNTLTYGQFLQWAKNLNQHFGRPSVGFPAGPTGLMARFIQGYLLPAFTGHLNTSFQSKWAVAAWEYMNALWKYVHPQSLTYNFLQDPLQAGEILVGWEHVARMGDALRNHPKDYVVFPAPKGPKGRAYLPVLAGLAIPKTSPNVAGAKALIKWLDGISAQARTLSTVGFFPVVAQKLSKRLPPGLLAIAAGVKAQTRSKDGLPSLLPVGLGANGGAFNKIFTDTFTRIVVNHESITAVLADEGPKLQAVLNTAGAPCWKPDPPSSGTCQVGSN
jgi:multiple sugar transport system substrate-binding protein